MRSLVETGVLNGKHADYHSTTSIVELKIPQTIEALLNSRVDRLSLVDKRLLQAAAVIGYEVPLSILQAVANLRPDRLREALKRSRMPNSSTRQTCFRTSSTGSSTGSFTTQLTGCCRRTGAARSIPPPSLPVSRYMPIG